MTDKYIIRTKSARIPTKYGDFKLCVYTNSEDDKEHLALFVGDIENVENVLTRVHSECFTGDVLGSLRCDCGDQLSFAMKKIAKQGHGVIVYMRQEGRGIGLSKKIEAYNLQDAGHDTVDANILLGHLPDEREYSLAALILKDLKVKSIRLLTNNPTKIKALESEGIAVKERIGVEGTVHPENAQYLMTKVKRMNHILSIESLLDSHLEKDHHESQPKD
ncbi:MAG: GTP cyclohydrolase II [Pseudohongiellaceae bacterium]